MKNWILTHFPGTQCCASGLQDRLVSIAVKKIFYDYGASVKKKKWNKTKQNWISIVKEMLRLLRWPWGIKGKQKKEEEIWRWRRRVDTLLDRINDCVQLDNKTHNQLILYTYCLVNFVSVLYMCRFGHKYTTIIVPPQRHTHTILLVVVVNQFAFCFFTYIGSSILLLLLHSQSFVPIYKKCFVVSRE